MKEVKLLKLVEVPAIVLKMTGLTVSRQTVYNWASIGRRLRGTQDHVHLKVMRKIGQLFTTEKLIHNFLIEIGE